MATFKLRKCLDPGKTMMNSVSTECLSLFKFYHQNVQCLTNKNMLIEKVTMDLNLDVLCLSEHWLSSEELNEYSNIGNLSLAYGYCRSTKIHGGVAIYSRFSPTQYKVIDRINSLSTELECELACIELVELNLVLVAVYISPNGRYDSFMDIMEKVLSYINQKKGNAIICGDFNLLFSLQGQDRSAMNFVNLCSMYGLRITITDPTRHNNCLDNVFTSFGDQLNVSLRNFHVSDHLGQLFVLNNVELVSNVNSNTCPVFKNVPNINDKTVNLFKYLLSRENWSEVFTAESTDESFNIFVNSFKYYYDISFTKRIRVNPRNTKKPNKPTGGTQWYTPELGEIKNRLDFLYPLAKNDPQNCNFFRTSYNRLKACYRIKIREAKKMSNMIKIKSSENQTKSLWNIVNKTKKGSSSTYKSDDSVFSPDEFNKFFVNVTKEIKQTLTSQNTTHCALDFLARRDIPENITCFSFNDISENDVLNVVKQLSNKSSKDHFGLSNRLIKDTICCYITPLTALINKCMSQGEFPNILKVTKVIPVFKKGKKDQLNNFRPIAIVPVLSKVIEIIIGKQLMHYMESNKLICSSQFGFRKGLSTTNALIKLVEQILGCFEDKELAAVTFCDLSKAFDCVSHELLVNKLQYYKIEGSALKIFQSYLKNRKQYVVYNDKESSSLDVNCGVPQGSVLGPILFIIMINDLSESVPADVVLYADDTTIINKQPSSSLALAQAKLNQNLIQNWLTANELVLNTNKTVTTFFGLKEKPEQLSENPTFLGLTLDPTLCWHQHIIGLKIKLSRSMYALKRLCGELDQNGIRTAYFGIFQAHIAYGLIVWGGASHAEEVFILQKKAIRIIAGAGRLDHCRDIFVHLRILTLPCLYIMQCLLYLRNNEDRTVLRNEIHSYNTRNSHLINLPPHRLSKSEKNPLYIASRFMNKLPVKMKILKDCSFKLKLHNFLLNNAFYSISEFLLSQWTDDDFF
uniref:Reverse transcriptase domain-containing protein n=2 Tax=Graphocephala atropunctata TaxID=36148 RepID=A0A1B6LG28_9HEMI